MSVRLSVSLCLCPSLNPFISSIGDGMSERLSACVIPPPPFLTPSTALPGNGERGAWKRIMGHEGGLSQLLLNSINLLRSLYLDWQKYLLLFMPDMITKPHKQTQASTGYYLRCVGWEKVGQNPTLAPTLLLLVSLPIKVLCQIWH